MKIRDLKTDETAAADTLDEAVNELVNRELKKRDRYKGLTILRTADDVEVYNVYAELPYPHSGLGYICRIAVC